MRKRNRNKIIIGIEVMILSITVSLLGPNAASANPPSNGVSYNKNGQVTVENALDNLYSKANYGNATAGDILKGKKALVGGKEVVGIFTCPTLASLTPGDATPENIDEGKIAWVNGKRIVGTKVKSLTYKVKIGDYISYTPKSVSYTISSSDSDYFVDQTINPSELNVWRVIQKNQDGTVDVVSEFLSSEKIYLGSAFSVYVGLLNKIAKQYETEGITVGSRHIGYAGYSREFCDTASIGNCPTDIDYIYDERLVKNSIGTLSAKSIGSETSSSIYYLASRNNYNSSGAHYMGFRIVESDGDVGLVAQTSGSSKKAGPYPIRPIVVLKASLKVIGGNGTKDSPYTLGI